MISKAFRVSLAVMIVLTLTVGMGHADVYAQYTSGIQVANLSNSTATVQLTGYRTDGSSVEAGTDNNVPANGSKTFFPLTVPDGFNGSVVVSSSAEAAAISNILTSDFSAAASYVGLSSGATSVSLPLLMKDNAGFTTWFAVQNAGSSAETVNVAYSDGTNNSATIQPKSAHIFNQANETHNAAVFAATITSGGGQPLVAVAIQESADILFAYTGFTGGTPNPVFPLVNANNGGYITGIQIQNAGTAETTVTLSYTPSLAGTACAETQTIAAGASATFALAAFANDNNPSSENCAAGSTFVGSAKVTANSANQDLVGIGNQLLPGVNGEAYGSFNPADATNRVVMPLIMDRNGGFFTGFSVQNVGTANATVSCTFSDTSYTVPSTTLAPDGALANLQNNQIANGYVGSATCTATESTAKLVAVVNQLGSAPGADQFLVYEGASASQ